MSKESKPQRANPFKIGLFEKLGVDVSTSRKRSKNKLRQISHANSNISPASKLDVDALIDGSTFIDQYDNNFVNVPHNKQALHPATYFKDLYLIKALEDRFDDKEIIARLDISEEQFYSFLKQEIPVTKVLAKKLKAVTGMRDEFWLRAQAKFDSLYIDRSGYKSINFFEITIHLDVGNPSLSMDDIDDRLYEAGFDDAFINHNGKGAISVSIEREAANKKELIEQAKIHLLNIFPNLRYKD